MLAVAVPMVSAFESNTINVTSFVRQAIITGKSFAAAPATTDLDGDGDIDCDGIDDVADIANNPSGVSEDSCYDPATAFLSAPEAVVVGEKVCWNVTISVTNDNPAIMWQAVLTDKFSAEMTDPQQILGDVPVVVHEMNSNKGKGSKKRSSGAIEIKWWVDYDEFTPAPYPETNSMAFVPDTNQIDDDDGNFKTPAPGSSGLAVGETAQLAMHVCTGLNPSGRQSYTSPGCYNFNSGLTVKWLVGDPLTQMELHQMSFDGNPLAVLGRAVLAPFRTRSARRPSRIRIPGLRLNWAISIFYGWGGASFLEMDPPTVDTGPFLWIGPTTDITPPAGTVCPSGAADTLTNPTDPTDFIYLWLDVPAFATIYNPADDVFDKPRNDLADCGSKTDGQPCVIMPVPPADIDGTTLGLDLVIQVTDIN